MDIHLINQPTKTVHGCECEETFNLDGITFNNKCILRREDNDKFWCKTKNNCGFKETHNQLLAFNDIYSNDEYSYDNCYDFNYSKINSDATPPYLDTKNNIFPTSFYIKNILGYLIVTIVILIIGYITYKYSKILGLLIISNIDLITQCIKFNGGLYNSLVLSYNTDSISPYPYNYIFSLTTIITNVIALTGVIFTILTREGDIKKKLIISVITLICTYFIPNSIVSEFQYKIFSLVNNMKTTNSLKSTNYTRDEKLHNLKIYGASDPVVKAKSQNITLDEIISKNNKLIKSKHIEKKINDITNRKQLVKLWRFVNLDKDNDSKITYDEFIKLYNINSKDLDKVLKMNTIDYQENIYHYFIYVLIGLIVCIVFILIEHFLVGYVDKSY